MSSRRTDSSSVEVTMFGSQSRDLRWALWISQLGVSRGADSAKCLANRTIRAATLEAVSQFAGTASGHEVVP